MATKTTKAGTPTKAPKAAKGKAPAKAKAPTKAAKQAKGKAPSKASPPHRPPDAASAAALNPTFSERFWHRLGLRAQKKEEEAHRLHEQQVAAEKAAIEEADRIAREEHQRQLAEERKARDAAAREMARIAREEDERLKREAEEAQQRAAEERKQQRRQAAADRREAARQAKEEAARQAAEKAEARRVAKQRKALERQAQQEAAAAARLEAEAEERRRAAESEAQAEVELRERADAHGHEEADEDAAPPEEAAEPSVAARDDAEEETDDGKAEAEEAEGDEGEEVVVEREAEDDGAHVVIRKGGRRPAKGKAAGKPKQDAARDAEAEEDAEAPVEGPAVAVPHAPPSPATPLDAQADRVAAELRARRSKPITIEADDDAVPTLPVGRGARGGQQEEKETLELDPAPPARMADTAPRGLSVPEQYLLLTLEEGWDERRERLRPGGLGGALAGALVLDLVLQRKVRVQRDRFQVTDATCDDAAHAVADKLQQWQDRPSLAAMTELAKWLPRLLPVYKQRMADRGLIDFAAWRHLGLFYRSQVALLDVEAQERLRNKLGRAIAGGGRPDAPTILALGLLEASGQFGLVVPEGAQAYNRKRLNGLLGGKDVMGYKVDDELKGIQEAAVRTVLDNVRTLTVRG